MKFLFLLLALVSCTENKNDISILCEQKSQITSIDLKGTLYLNSQFLDSENETAELAAKKQAQYFAGQFYNNFWGNDKHVLSPAVETKILKISHVSYPLELEIDDLSSKKVDILDPYIQKAIDRGKTTKEDKALKVEYSLKLSVASCLSKKDKNSLLKKDIFLPIDPYLIYWGIPKSERVKTNWLNISTETINPCSSTELADYNSPGYYWYFWSTDEMVDGKSCADYLSQVGHIEKVKVQINKEQTVESTAKFPPRQFKKISIIFGLMDHYNKPRSLEKLLKMVEEKNFSMAKKKLFTRDEQSFLKLVENLKGIFDLREIKGSIKEKILLLEVSAATKKSKENVTIEIYFGPTDTFDPDLGAKHWSYLKRSLIEKDLMIYWGHSGLGENLKIQNMEQALKLENILKTNNIKTQTFVYLGCYTYSYFGLDIKNALQNRTLVTTGAALFEGDRVIPGILQMLMGNVEKSLLKAEDFIIYEEI